MWSTPTPSLKGKKVSSKYIYVSSFDSLYWSSVISVLPVADNLLPIGERPGIDVNADNV